MDQGRVSVSYARALLGWADDHHLATEVYNQSVCLNDLLVNSPDFHLLLHSPIVPLSKKTEIVSNVLKKCAPDLAKFVALAVKNGREKQLINIILVFQKLYREKSGIVRSSVESAFELSEKTKGLIETFLSKTYNKKIELEFSIKPDIIGGFVLTINDRLLDKSVKAELDKLRRRFKGIAY